MQGVAIWLVGNGSQREEELATELEGRSLANGTRIDVLTGFGESTGGATGSPGLHAETLSAMMAARVLTRRGTSVVIPVREMPEEARRLVRVELPRSISVGLSASMSLAGAGAPAAGTARAVPSAYSTAVHDDRFDLTLAVDRESGSTVQHVLDAVNATIANLPPADEAPRTGASELEVTILMPCLNEADAIGECVAEAVKTLQDWRISGEVLVVDNGSTDGSPEIARAVGARVVIESQKGYGSAYLRGLREGRGKYFVMGDSDGTYDFTLVPVFLKLLRDGHEFVNGSRLKGAMDVGAIPFLHRYVGVPMLTWLLNFLSGARFSDAHCGMRGFSREAVRKMGLRSPGMEFASEMIFQASRTHLRTSEIPVPYRMRKGDSKLRTFSDGWRHIRFMLLQSPTHLFVLPGLAFLTLGLFITLALVAGRVEVAGLSFDVHFMVVGSVLAMLGYQLAALGVAARVYALSEGVFRRDTLIDWGLRRLSLERGIVIGAGVSGLGLAVLVYIVTRWVSLDFGFGSAGMIRPAILGMTLLVLGAQTVFSAFFLSLVASRSLEGRPSVN